MKRERTKIERRNKRRNRVRKSVIGTAERPRLNVFRSLRGMYVQLIDDSTGKTLFAVHSKGVKAEKSADRAGKVAIAYTLGLAIAEKAKAANITAVVFDRAGYKYHGRVAAVADGAREGGLQL